MKKAFLIAILFSNVIFSEEIIIKIPESTISDLDYKNSLLENQKNYLLKENKEIERRAGAERDKRMSNGVAEIYKKTGIITEEDPRLAALVTLNTTLEARVREQEMRIREYEQKIDAYRNSANPTDFHGIASIREELGSSQNRSSGRTLAELEVISNLLGSRSESVISNADTQGMLLQQTQIATTLAEKVEQQQEALQQQQTRLAAHEAELAELRETHQEALQQQQTSLTAAHEEELALREQQQQTSLGQAKTREDELTLRVEQQQEALQQQQTRLAAHEAELAELRGAHQEEILLATANLQKLDEEKNQQQEAHKQEILQQQTRLTTAHEEELAELRETHQEALQKQKKITTDSEEYVKELMGMMGIISIKSHPSNFNLSQNAQLYSDHFRDHDSDHTLDNVPPAQYGALIDIPKRDNKDPLENLVHKPIGYNAPNGQNGILIEEEKSGTPILEILDRSNQISSKKTIRQMDEPVNASCYGCFA